MAERKKIIVEVTASLNPEDQLSKFVQLCKTIQQLGVVGATRTIRVWVDGDGAADLRFDFGELDTSNVKPLGFDKDPVELFID